MLPMRNVMTEEDKAQHTLKFLFLHLHSRGFFSNIRVRLFEHKKKLRNKGPRQFDFRRVVIRLNREIVRGHS
jgi:hypothetical protein